MSRYTDADLEQDLLSPFPGKRNFALVLQDVPEEARGALIQEAHYIGNHVGGRPSDNLSTAARHFKARGVASFTSDLARAIYEREVAS